jgi:hypothetical protein
LGEFGVKYLLRLRQYRKRHFTGVGEHLNYITRDCGVVNIESSAGQEGAAGIICAALKNPAGLCKIM